MELLYNLSDQNIQRMLISISINNYILNLLNINILTDKLTNKIIKDKNDICIFLFWIYKICEKTI